jgi:hypothetical protein
MVESRPISSFFGCHGLPPGRQNSEAEYHERKPGVKLALFFDDFGPNSDYKNSTLHLKRQNQLSMWLIRIPENESFS